MESWLQQFIQLLPNGSGYLLLLFIIAFAESLPLVGLLVPGSTLIVLAGFLALHGKNSIQMIMVITICGAFLGDLLSFWLGVHYGPTLLKLQIFKKQQKLVAQAQVYFVNHGGKSIFFARFLGPIRGITPFIAGLAKMSGRSFISYTVISAILWGICYPGIGYFGGSSWQQAQSLSARVGLVVIVLLAVTLIHYWVKRLLRNNQN